jgi:hypothetical protein
MSRQLEDLTGQTFGKLTVLRLEKIGKNYARLYLCQCDCGGTICIYANHLKTRHTKSCGCIRKTQPGSRTTHGMRDTAEYHSYAGAKGRCTNPRNHKFLDYGGRGIKFLYASFPEFLADVGPKPPGTSLDRINNEGHYQVGNCRWATAKEQSKNRREFSKDRVNCEILVAYAKAVMGELHGG